MADISFQEIQERVNRGVKLLNKYRRGWRGKIKPRQLDMGSCTRCVIGQLYGDYTNGGYDLMNKIDGTTPSTQERALVPFLADHGFTFNLDEVILPNKWRQLAKAWRKVLKPKVKPCSKA